MSRRGTKIAAQDVGPRDADLDRMSPAGRKIFRGLMEVNDALESGEPLEELFRVHKTSFLIESREYDGAAVKAVRDSLKASQPLFAMILGVDVGTVRSWEQGRRTPSPMARRFLDDISQQPRRYKQKIKDSFVSERVEPKRDG